MTKPRFQRPLIEPDVRFSRIRLSDHLHQQHASGNLNSEVLNLPNELVEPTTFVEKPPWVAFTGLPEMAVVFASQPHPQRFTNGVIVPLKGTTAMADAEVLAPTP